jgi:hypothetical protein
LLLLVVVSGSTASTFRTDREDQRLTTNPSMIHAEQGSSTAK